MLIFAVLILRRPAVALALAICMFGFEQFLQANDPFFVQQGNLVNIAVGVMLIYACCMLLIKGELTLRLPPVFYLIAALLGYAYFTLYVIDAVPLAFALWRRNLPYFVALLILAPFVINSTHAVRAAMAATLLFGTFVAIELYFNTEWGRRGVQFAMAGVGTRGEIVDTGTPLALGTLGGTIAIIAALIDFPRLGPAWKTFRWAIVALGIALAFRTESRGQVLATFATLAVFVPMSGRSLNRKGIIAAVVGFVMLALILYVLLPAIETRRWDRFEEALEGRTNAWLFLLSQWVRGGPMVWFIGAGASSSWRLLDTYPHNVTMEVLYELGLIGFSLWIAIIAYVGWAYFDTYRKYTISPGTFSAFTAITALFTFHLAISFKEGSLYGQHGMLMYALVIDRMAYYIRQTYPSRDQGAAIQQWQKLMAATKSSSAGRSIYPPKKSSVT